MKITRKNKIKRIFNFGVEECDPNFKGYIYVPYILCSVNTVVINSFNPNKKIKSRYLDVTISNCQ